jgi:two-component system, response regulator YesN
MKRILLVDDDFLALNAFFTLADWNHYGLEITYEAHNGQEALSYLAGHTADIAVIDVCMPDMDGIALLGKIRALDPSILCIMLSSYSDYPYVREALKNGAIDYLLKHEITKESILAMLAQYGAVKTIPDAGEDTEALLLKLFRDHTAPCGNLKGILLYAYPEVNIPLIEAQQHSILQTCRHILHVIPSAAVCMPSEGELLLFFPQDILDKNADKAEECAAKVKKALSKYHNTAYTFLQPKFCEDAAHMDNLYQLAHRQYMPRAPVSKASVNSQDGISLMFAVVNNQKGLIAQIVHALYASASAKNDINSFCNEMCGISSHIRQLLSLPPDAMLRLPGDPGQMEPFFIRLFTELAEYGGTHTASHYSQNIRQALTYLDQHYAEDICLNDVARYCNVSYNHLSFLFKKETGENIIGYLNKLRIYHAARLILFGSMPISSICVSVGFNGYNHFFTTFRTITGMTPSEFRKSTAAVEWMLKLHQQNPGF